MDLLCLLQGCFQLLHTSRQVRVEDRSFRFALLPTLLQSLQRLHERWQQSEAERAILDADLAARMKQLEAALQETQEVHAVCEGLQQELARNRDLLARTAQERDQLGERLKATVDDFILRHRLELEGLATSRQEISTALDALRQVEAPHLTPSTNE